MVLPLHVVPYLRWRDLCSGYYGNDRGVYGGEKLASRSDLLYCSRSQPYSVMVAINAGDHIGREEMPLSGCLLPSMTSARRAHILLIQYLPFPPRS
jgi:hypothetical protein